jgi:phosphatidylserine decarboxylase
MKNQNSIIAREGWPFVSLLLIISLSFLLRGGFMIPSAVSFGLALFTFYFFRNPEREIDADENSVVAPADGKVIKVEEVREDELLKDDVVLISIFMSLFNVHINRVPVSGTVIRLKYHPGKFVSANLDKASTSNERCSMLIKTRSKKIVMVVQIAGLVARRIVSYPRLGNNIEKGKRYGLIRFGSRLDVYMPKDSEIVAKVGQKIKAGEVLGYLK